MTTAHQYRKAIDRIAALESKVERLTEETLRAVAVAVTLTQATALLSERLEELESGGLETDHGDQVMLKDWVDRK